MILGAHLPFRITDRGRSNSFDVSSEDMRNALMGLCTIDDVSISREIIGFAYMDDHLQ